MMMMLLLGTFTVMMLLLSCAVCFGAGFIDMKTELREYLKEFADSGTVSASATSNMWLWLFSNTHLDDNSNSSPNKYS